MVTELHADGCATFADGRREGPVDVVVYCTGYRCGTYGSACMQYTSTIDAERKRVSGTLLARPPHATAQCARLPGRVASANLQHGTCTVPCLALSHTAPLPPFAPYPAATRSPSSAALHVSWCATRTTTCTRCGRWGEVTHTRQNGESPFAVSLCALVGREAVADTDLGHMARIQMRL